MVHFAHSPLEPLMDKATCLNCNRTDEQAPLLNMIFKGEVKYICPQCLPTLIHKTHLLADKLPGLEVSPPTEQ
jgi:hypothetical protein